ncbi:hypothetical protein BC835DRAFT_1337723 [Cytidiella melzeri]|nr:hypothetical protein BC835DRAFT_1337723 [Cytidiella melzeri]
MAEAGPSGSQSTSNGAAARHPDFGFPDQEGSQPPHRSTRPERSVNMNSLGLGHPSTSRRPTTSRISSLESNSSRRRVRSIPADEEVLPPGPSRLRQIHDLEIEPHKRVSSLSRRATGKQKANSAQAGITDMHALSQFSDEYDLSHEDPRILEDVQRALHLKARREARLKAMQTKKQPVEPAGISDQGSLSSFSSHASPIRARISEPLPSVMSPMQLRANSLESEVDFSPSVRAAPIHPVPSSSDGGATLDWTASGSEDERDKRWPLLAKRRTKDKGTAANRVAVESQESVYSEKLAQIKARVKPHTVRKAAMTAEQLQRRYSVLLDPSRPAANLLSAVRWYNRQETIVRTALDNAQPLTWLKHLLSKRTSAAATRPPWHLTALIIEEYAKATYPLLQPIPEDTEMPEGIMVTPATSPMSNSVIASPGRTSSGQSGSSRSWSWMAPHSLEPSLSRRRGEFSEDGISFEPQVDSGRSSAGGDSRRSSYDLAVSHKQVLVHSTTESPGSSLRNESPALYGMSAPSTRLNFRELANRVRRKPYERSEEALSSGRNSISEQSLGEEASPSGKRRKRTRPTSLKTPISIDGGSSDAGENTAEGRQNHPDTDVPLTARAQQGSTHFAERTVTGADSPNTSSVPYTPPAAPAKPRAINRSRQRRRSLPALDQLLIHEQEKQQLQATEEQERREYEHKRQLLEDTMDQNRRSRQLLQRVGAHIREYEVVQSRLSDLLGKPYTSVPSEVLDALSHDPASVIGATRRYKSWRAVEDIQERLCWQRQTLRNFVLTLDHTEGSCGGGSAFEDILTTLSASLEQLEGYRHRLADDADEVAETLGEVKESHVGVKKKYLEAMAHTSLIYPELSQIVALEENYRNKYQQIWDIGLDALTLLLDTVTPVWRNYGKVIGEDVQDFLIIPWYRNEFTGEKQRYPIKHLPRRSFRHWIGLFLFSLISKCVLVLQTSAAISYTAHYNIPWITNPGFRWLVIPFFTAGIFIQWISVIIECCIVLAQIGVIFWWLGWAVRIFH